VLLHFQARLENLVSGNLTAQLDIPPRDKSLSVYNQLLILKSA
jgi:hypothetical protein